MTVVAVGSRFSKALFWDADDSTWDWNARPGSPENTMGLRPMRVVSLKEMLERKWDIEDTPFNHGVQYLVLGPDGQPLATQPRLKDTGVDLLRSKGFEVVRTMLWTEVDLPDHKTWKQIDQEIAMAQIEAVREAMSHGGPLHGAIGQYSRRGMHFIQILTRHLEIFESDAYEREWHKQIARCGVLLDPSAKGWKHMYRFPGAPYDIADE